MIEQYTNAASTTLAADITALSQTSIDVVDASSFPSSPQFRILVNGEIMLVTAVAGNTFTVVRGVENTQPTTCLTGTFVDHILTAGALTKIKEDGVIIDAYANLPSAALVRKGTIFVPTDSFYDMLVHNGTSWDHMRSGQLLTPPDNSLFSWANQGSSTVTTTYGGIIAFSTPAPAGVTMRYKSQPSTPYTLTTAFLPQYLQTNYAQVGLGWRDSSGKLALCSVAYNSSWIMRFTKFNSPTSYNSDYTAIAIPPIVVHGSMVWMRLTNDGTNRTCQVSSNGRSWTTVHTTTYNDFLTPNSIGFVWGDCSIDMGTTMLHWVEA